MTKRLSEQESYFSMSEFLDSYYWASKDDDLGSLLGSVTLWSDDGELFDQAIAEDWHAFFSDVSNENHTVFESFQAVKQFVNEYLPDIAATTPVSGSLTYNIRIICEMTESQRNQEPVWQNWVAAVNWITNPNVVPVNESPFLKTGQSLPNPKEKGFSAKSISNCQGFASATTRNSDGAQSGKGGLDTVVLCVCEIFTALLSG